MRRKSESVVGARPFELTVRAIQQAAVVDNHRRPSRLPCGQGAMSSVHVATADDEPED